MIGNPWCYPLHDGSLLGLTRCLTYAYRTHLACAILTFTGVSTVICDLLNGSAFLRLLPHVVWYFHMTLQICRFSRALAASVQPDILHDTHMGGYA